MRRYSESYKENERLDQGHNVRWRGSDFEGQRSRKVIVSVPPEDFWLNEEKNAMKELKICCFIKAGAWCGITFNI